MKSGYRLIDRQKGEIRNYEVSTESVASCSDDGRYLFVSIAGLSGVFRPRYSNFSLTYFDLQSGERVDVFTKLTGIESDFRFPLVSPNAKYLIGPKDLGDKLNLPGGEVIKVVSSDHFKGMNIHCPLQWDGADAALVMNEENHPLVRSAKNLSKTIVSVFDVVTEKWNRAESDWLELSDGGCTGSYSYDGHIYVKAASERKGWREGSHDVYEFSNSAGKLNVKKRWLGVADFAVGRDGSLVFTKTFGVQLLGGVETRMSPSAKQVDYEVRGEKDGRVVFHFRRTIDESATGVWTAGTPYPEVVGGFTNSALANTDPTQRHARIFVHVRQPN
jgi:hypothetical protein